MDAPKKLYLHTNHKGEVGASWLTFPLSDNDIEYIRMDELMDGAVDATVESDLDPHGADYGDQKLDIKWGQLESKGFKPGTKVKVIIIKEK